MIVLPADHAAIERAAEALRRGALVAFPTETVYGLGADATDPEALAAIFACKGRPMDHPLIVHLAAADELARWVGSLPAAAHLLAEVFWPGPLTLVLPWPTGLANHTESPGAGDASGDSLGVGSGPGVGTAANRVISAVATGQRATIGVRVPDHPVALALLRALGRPVAAPSANRFGRVSPTTAAHVAAEFAGSSDQGHNVPNRSGAPAGSARFEPALSGVVSGWSRTAGGPTEPELILDGGPCRVGVESTIVELVDRPTLLRAGGVPAEAIEAVLGHPLLMAGGPSRAPGMLASHYAPRAAVVVVDDDRLPAVVAAERAAGRRVAVLGVASLPDGVAPDVVLLGPIHSTDGYARLLYHCLREADRQRVDIVVALCPPERGLGRAVADRLRRASAPRL